MVLKYYSWDAQIKLLICSALKDHKECLFLGRECVLGLPCTEHHVDRIRGNLSHRGHVRGNSDQLCSRTELQFSSLRLKSFIKAKLNQCISIF